MIKPFIQSKLIYQFVKSVFPQVKKELSYWQTYASKIPDKILSYQAISSIQKKSFHAQGGCIYSLYYNQINLKLIKFIVALQTISDYLDNLCDRAGIEDEKSFLQLHQAITDALRPDNRFFNYYNTYPHNNDGGYLYHLVSTCKSYIRTLPSYHLVQEKVLYLGKLYGEMQSYKHINKNKREEAMNNWSNKYIQIHKDLSIWEFSAAAGSTLGIFLLCTIAQSKDLEEKEVQKIMDAYFPWVCGLHILLDYFIDEQEDLYTGDLNFLSYYKDPSEKEKRLIYFLKQSLYKTLNLKNPLFHRTVIEGLLAMYLSDTKITLQDKKITSKKILKEAFYTTNILYNCCKLLRIKKIIK
ncbi:tetraprenyl-beta-curcumene synthase family protein [Crassaminicella thermophila]|uniref:Tetraprenyl-beta-curcumene synthase family protein n=1 Tax=Crassaminicella thermophila TaxID=2599308 RepID=A0A5C0SA89_CRATE|nr:tetraprenyl-beta-curcumene synthase family protein [Crassaminicella thermophila]QEK10897.1 tetraprenyl-beta-curcumene synthase family protein [Crassaminicella thermophila]